MSTVVVNHSGTVYLSQSYKHQYVTINWPPSGVDLSDTTIKQIDLSFNLNANHYYYYVYTYTNNTGTAVTTGTFSGYKQSPIVCTLSPIAWRDVTSGNVTVKFQRYCDMVGQEWGNVSYSNIKLIITYEPNEVIVPSQTSVAKVNVGESQTVIISNDSDKVSHVVKWSYSGEDAQGTTVNIEETKTLASTVRSAAWAIPQENIGDICRKFPNSITAVGTLYLTTKNGSEIIRSEDPFRAELTLPANIVGPEFDTPALTITSSNPTIPYLQNNATLTVVPHIVPKYNATITRIQISTPDYTGDVQASSTSFSFPLKTTQS